MGHGESRLRARPKGMKTNEICDRPLETFGAATTGIPCFLNCAERLHWNVQYKKSEHKDLAWEYVSWLCGPEGAKVTAGCGNRPAWVSEEVAEVLASVDGFPQDENSKKALLPSMVSIEIGVSDKLAEIQTILNEEHTMIMTREISVDEGIEEMNERVAELYE